MITLKFTPDEAPVVDGERLYAVQWTQDRKTYKDLGLKVRAKNSFMAEKKLLYCFARELDGKTVDFNLEELIKKYKGGGADGQA